MRPPNLPRLNVAAVSSLLLATMALVSVARRLSPAWVIAAVVGAVVAGHLGRRPALHRRRPRVDDMRSLVVATAGMTLGLIAGLLLALPYVTQLVHR